METVACPVCHANDSEPHLHVPDRFNLEQGDRYTLCRCRRCSLVFLNPRPAEAGSGVFYTSEQYTPFVSEKSSPGRLDRIYTGLRTYNLAWKRRQIERLATAKGRLLDLGCGTGEFLQEMRKAGWQVRGVERDFDAAMFAIRELKLNVVAGTLETLPAAQDSFDVVTMWHVLEHLYHPHRTLIAIRDLLKPGGLLVIAVPNAESFDARCYRRNWIAYDAPRHLQHFSFAALCSLCEMHKLRLAAKMTLPLDACFNALMSEMLIAERQQRGRRPGLVQIARGGCLAGLSLVAGMMSGSARRPRGATLLTIWRK